MELAPIAEAPPVLAAFWLQNYEKEVKAQSFRRYFWEGTLNLQKSKHECELGKRFGVMGDGSLLCKASKLERS